MVMIWHERHNLIFSANLNVSSHMSFTTTPCDWSDLKSLDPRDMAARDWFQL